jgi:hypothetical protein
MREASANSVAFALASSFVRTRGSSGNNQTIEW